MFDAGDGGIRLRSWICAAVAALALLSACSGNDSIKTDAKPCSCDAGTAGAGCVEVRVDTSILPSSEQWSPTSLDPVYLPIHPFWRDGDGIHAVWSAYSLPGTGDPAYSDAHLVVSSFPASGGLPYAQAIYDVYPTGLLAALSGKVTDTAANPDGMVAIGIRYRSSPSADPTERVEFVQLADPTARKEWTPPWPTSQWSLGEISWDGEAFAVHFSLSNPGLQDWGVQLVRFSPDGELLSGPVLAANIGPTQDDFGAAVDTTSGTTVFVGPAVNGVSLSGHLRDGTSIFPGEPALTKEIVAQGVPAENSAYSGSPAVALDGSEAATAWRGLYGDNYIQTLADFNAVTPAIVIPQPKGGMRSRVLAPSPSGWVMFARSYARGDVYEIENDQIARVRQLVSHSFESCWEAKACPDWPVALDIRNLELLRWGDELWLGFLDLSDSPDVDRPTAYRIVNAAANCEYRSLYDEHHPK